MCKKYKYLLEIFFVINTVLKHIGNVILNKKVHTLLLVKRIHKKHTQKASRLR